MGLCKVCWTKYTYRKDICPECKDRIKRETKTCSKCNKELSLKEFYLDRYKHGRFKSICKKCYSNYYKSHMNELDALREKLDLYYCKRCGGDFLKEQMVDDLCTQCAFESQKNVLIKI